tara:strand:+ start:4445 stop:5680 length:1236 start_codon:yes stop_codon:yes gene_type:complete
MEENKNVLEEVKTDQVVEETTEQPVAEETKKEEPVAENVTKVTIPSFGEVGDEPEVTKIDLSKPLNQEENEVKEDNINNDGVVAESENAEPTQEQEEVQPEVEAQEEEIKKEIEHDEKVEEVASVAEKAIEESMETGNPLPENIQKLVDFMEETGGSLDEYVTLNKDYTDVPDVVVLREYYKATKPHLSDEEINFLMEDQFSFDEEYGEEKENKRKKLALKEQVAEARNHLDGLKSKYYEDIKSGSKLTSEQKEAVDFFNKHNESSKANQEIAKVQQDVFVEKTNNVFDQGFEGFEYNVGDKTYRYNVRDIKGVKETQSDISNFIGKFLDKNNNLEDAAGYHKSLFTAMNADAIAKHFYDQGQADALRDSIKSGKNIDMTGRSTHEDTKPTGGMTFKPLNTSDGFSFKIKK